MSKTFVRCRRAVGTTTRRCRAPSIAQHRGSKTSGERQHSIALPTISADELLVTVEHRRGVRRFVWIETNDEHAAPSRRSTRWERPGGSNLKRVRPPASVVVKTRVYSSPSPKSRRNSSSWHPFEIVFPSDPETDTVTVSVAAVGAYEHTVRRAGANWKQALNQVEICFPGRLQLA